MQKGVLGGYVETPTGYAVVVHAGGIFTRSKTKKKDSKDSLCVLQPTCRYRKTYLFLLKNENFWKFPEDCYRTSVHRSNDCRRTKLKVTIMIWIAFYVHLNDTMEFVESTRVNHYWTHSLSLRSPNTWWSVGGQSKLDRMPLCIV